MGLEGNRDSLPPPLSECRWDGAAGHHGVKGPSGRGPLTLPAPRLTPPHTDPLSQHNGPSPLLPPGPHRGRALAPKTQIMAKGHPRPLPKVLKCPSSLSAHTLSHCNPRGLRAPRRGERGWEAAVAPGPEKATGCHSGTAVRFQEGLPTRPPPPPASYSVFLLLATQRPHWPHPPCGPASSPPPPTRSHLASSSVSLSRLSTSRCGVGTHRWGAGLGGGYGDPQASGGPLGRQ